MGIKQIIALESDTVSEKYNPYSFRVRGSRFRAGRKAGGQIYHDYAAYRAFVVPVETFVVGY